MGNNKNMVFKPVGHEGYLQYLACTAETRQLGDTPIDFRNPEEVRQRVLDYFAIAQKTDIRPTVTGLAMAFGMRRQRLYELKMGTYRKGGKYKDIPEESLEEIRKGYDMLENLLEQYMLADDINPITGKFMATNHFGYKDSSSIDIGTIADSEERPSIDSIRAKYIGADNELPSGKKEEHNDE